MAYPNFARDALEYTQSAMDAQRYDMRKRMKRRISNETSPMPNLTHEMNKLYFEAINAQRYDPTKRRTASTSDSYLFHTDNNNDVRTTRHHISVKVMDYGFSYFVPQSPTPTTLSTSSPRRTSSSHRSHPNTHHQSNSATTLWLSEKVEDGYTKEIDTYNRDGYTLTREIILPPTPPRKPVFNWFLLCCDVKNTFEEEVQVLSASRKRELAGHSDIKVLVNENTKITYQYLRRRR
ncbi:hypothetical protein AMATHDRAFT_51571 [Amanita thiersii Skay4041]|uniref:Uncharacterized protein n=1 Tax=Amanita thiersii Skay4041 TaxID=703135 RepID=A0A2A9ND14_9AGAR|nr:hypothetical protein AMATHDRAFT_51571 [Amanita thiersii Skay4041]